MEDLKNFNKFKIRRIICDLEKLNILLNYSYQSLRRNKRILFLSMINVLKKRQSE